MTPRRRDTARRSWESCASSRGNRCSASADDLDFPQARSTCGASEVKPPRSGLIVQSQLPLYPEQASNFAPQVDNLVLFVTAVCVFFALAICAAVVYFFFKYHRKRPDEIGVPIHGDLRLEIAWIVLPFFLLLAMFGWGAVIYVDYRQTPTDTLDVYVIGKQCMWKLQQADGARKLIS